MSIAEDLETEAFRFDLFALLRRLERSFPEAPRIGTSGTRREEYVALGEDPFLEFPASTIGRADRDPQGRLRLLVKFLGLMGPQGALPLATTEEALHWSLMRDDAFPRFLDIFNHRFLQLFYRAWADARPVAQHDRPEEDRFVAYLGSMIGIGSAAYRNLGSVPDPEKIAFAGLLAPQAKSASRLRGFLAGLFKVDVEVEQFVGAWLRFEPEERTRLGTHQCGLGVGAMLGASIFSVQDKFRVRIFAPDLESYERFLPTGDRCEPLADAVFLFVGEQLDWDVELALPASAVEPVRLGSSGRLGYTSWMAPNWAATKADLRCDARFHPAERQRARRQTGRHAAAPT
jgi:type VI secretion system protein ImpH